MLPIYFFREASVNLGIGPLLAGNPRIWLGPAAFSRIDWPSGRPQRRRPTASLTCVTFSKKFPAASLSAYLGGCLRASICEVLLIVPLPATPGLEPGGRSALPARWRHLWQASGLAMPCGEPDMVEAATSAVASRGDDRPPGKFYLGEKGAARSNLELLPRRIPGARTSFPPTEEAPPATLFQRCQSVFAPASARVFSMRATSKGKIGLTG